MCQVNRSLFVLSWDLELFASHCRRAKPLQAVLSKTVICFLQLSLQVRKQLVNAHFAGPMPTRSTFHTSPILGKWHFSIHNVFAALQFQMSFTLGHLLLILCLPLRPLQGPVAHSLGDSAFQYCVSLTKLDADFREIGAYAFSCCDGFLKGLEVRWDQLVTAGDCAFEFSTLFHFSSASVEYLGNQAFQYCTNQIRVMNCKKLREVNFSRVIIIGSRCFSSMTITEFSMERLVEIRTEGFKNSFIEIARYSRIETIGDGAFSE